MENLEIEALRKLVDDHPLKEIRGRFKVNLPFLDWDFKEEIGDVKTRISEFDKFLKETEPRLVFVTEAGQVLGNLEITDHDMFDDLPSYSDEYVLSFFPKKEWEENLTIILKVSPGWPDWDGGGEFIATIPIR